MSSSEEPQALSLKQAWVGPGWATMRFERQSHHGLQGQALELTVWKAVVGAEAWRLLRMRLALAEFSLQSSLTPEVQ